MRGGGVVVGEVGRNREQSATSFIPLRVTDYS